MTGGNRSELREAARHLVRYPLVLAEENPAMFGLIRRHSEELDQRFSQRFGYRLRVTSDTARLFKSTVVTRRPFTTGKTTRRSFKRREYTMLALILSVISAGQNVISLLELVNGIRSAASEAGVPIKEDVPGRRAIVTALRWLITHGVVEEAHMNIGRYTEDSSADAMLTIRHDRAKLLPLPMFSSAETVDQLLDRSQHRHRTWVRSCLLEEPVVYRGDLVESAWRDYRNDRHRAERMFEDMFGMHIETRAEGMAAIDPDGTLTDVRFPSGGGTVQQSALLLLNQLSKTGTDEFTRNAIVEMVGELADDNRKYWSSVLSEDPKQLTDRILEMLAGHKLVAISDGMVRFLPAAWRYTVTVKHEQGALL